MFLVGYKVSKRGKGSFGLAAFNQNMVTAMENPVATMAQKGRPVTCHM